MPRSYLSRRAAGFSAGLLMALALMNPLDARQAPAQLKGTSLRILTWSHFIPAYDAWLDKFAKEWGDKNGVKVRIDHIPHLELPARFAAVVIPALRISAYVPFASS